MSDDQQQQPEPSDDQPVDPRFADDPVTVHGKPRKRRRKLSKIEQDRLVEEIRPMLLMDVNEVDIRRDKAKKWNLTPKCLFRYVSIARKRNRSCLSESRDDSVASSIGYWARRKQFAEQTFQRERAMLERANQTIEQSQAAVDEIENRVRLDGRGPADNERLKILEMRIANAIEIREQCRRACYTAGMSGESAQREIDRIKGNIVQLHAQTDAKGNDVATLTPEQIADGMKHLGLAPLRFPPPKVIEVQAVDTTPEKPLAMPTNGHTNGHANGKAKSGVNGTNGHAKPTTNGHAKPKPKPETGGGDELQ